jgi:hypothetical protein
MGLATWLAQHWLDLVQSVGIIGGLAFTGYTIRKDEQARRIANAIAINAQYQQIWRALYEHPKLGRVVAVHVNLEKEPISVAEDVFVTTVILHLATVYRATRSGEYVRPEGLRQDVKEFFALPIPSVIWERWKQLQDTDFREFMDSCIR